MKAFPLICLLAFSFGSAEAKLPAPSEDAKAKAAETAAKTAWTTKVAEFQLCKSMDQVAAAYIAQQKAAAKEPKPTPTPACTDPGLFTYTPPESKPLEASGAHSPPQTAATPPSTPQPAASAPSK